METNDDTKISRKAKQSKKTNTDKLDILIEHMRNFMQLQDITDREILIDPNLSSSYQEAYNDLKVLAVETLSKVSLSDLFGYCSQKSLIGYEMMIYSLLSRYELNALIFRDLKTNYDPKHTSTKRRVLQLVLVTRTNDNYQTPLVWCDGFWEVLTPSNPRAFEVGWHTFKRTLQDIKERDVIISKVNISYKNSSTALGARIYNGLCEVC